MPEPFYSRDGIELYVGDNREVLPDLEPESISAVCTDPPYGLSKEPDIAEVLTHWLAGDDYTHTGGGFMGKTWDSFVPGPATWRAIVRTMKPGAHLCSFAGTRTYDLMGMAIRLAGLQYRDTLQYLFGSGFPKSANVSKMIDKRRAEDIPHVHAVGRFLRDAIGAHPDHTARTIGAHFGLNPRQVDQWAPRPTDNSSIVRAHVPTWEQWLQLKDLLGFGDAMDAEVWRLNGRKGQPGENWDKREVIGQAVRGPAGFSNEMVPRPWKEHIGEEYDITAPATDAARQWDGWGSNLKPSYEPILLARKPLAGTIAANVLAHGTGAINIDGTRVGSNGWEPGKSLCDSCAEHAGSVLRRTTRETRATTALSNAEQIMSERDTTAPDDTCRADTGCSNGRSPEARGASQSAGGSSSIGGFGVSTTAKSPRDSSSTTSTVSRLTTESRTCDSCGAEITRNTTSSIRASQTPHTGRWPTNLLMDDDAAAVLDAMSGVSKSTGGTGAASGRPGGRGVYGVYGRAENGGANAGGLGDTGGASRFFPVLPVDDPDTVRFLYASKAPAKERWGILTCNCETVATRSTAVVGPVTSLRSLTQNDCDVCGKPRKIESHPTQKPLALCRWLLTLVTPPGGVVLDPFAGSGSTLVAAAQLGIRAVGIEMDPEYAAIAAKRIDHALNQRARGVVFGNGTDASRPVKRTSGGKQGSMPQPMDWGKQTGRERPTGARWPSNVLMDRAAASVLDAMSGERKSGGVPPKRSPFGGLTTGKFNGQDTTEGIGPSSGGASRFMVVLDDGDSEPDPPALTQLPLLDRSAD
jgi:DNA modification methylase